MIQPQQEVLRELRRRLAERQAPAAAGEHVTSGLPALDKALVGGGFRRGALVEWLSPGLESGVGVLMTLAALAACRSAEGLASSGLNSSGGPSNSLACRGESVDKLWLVCDADRWWNPWPALRLLGGQADALIVARPASESEELWAAEQGLRSPAVGAVWLWRRWLRAHDFRRLQLAAEAGRAVGLLHRPLEARSQPSWADTRLLVEPLPPVAQGSLNRRSSGEAAAAGCGGRRWRLEVLRQRGGPAGAVVEAWLDEATQQTRAVESHDETPAVPASARVAPATAARRAARA